MTQSLIILFILSLLPSCGWLIVSGKNNSNYRQFDNPKTAEKSFNQSSVRCEGDDCIAYVGGLYSLSADRLGVGACSFTLVSKKQVLTNAHCIPEDLFAEDTFCVGRINLVFPKTDDYPFERVECAYIKKLSAKMGSGQVAHPDWALIRLNRNVQRSVPDISKDGLAPYSPLDLYKVNFDLNAETKSTGVLQKTSCLANTNHFLSKNNLGQVSPLIDVSHCQKKLIPGNSGSGYFNEQGQLVGIHSWGVLVEDSNEDWAQFYREQYPNLRQNFGGGTHTRCLPLGRTPELPSDCQFRSYDYEKLATLYSKINQQINFRDEFSTLRKQAVKENRDPRVQWTEREDFIFDLLDLNFRGVGQEIRNRVFLKLIKSKFPGFPICVQARQASLRVFVSHINRTSLATLADPETLEGRESSELSRSALYLRWNDSLSAYVANVTHFISNEDLSAFDLSDSKSLKVEIPLCP